MTPLSPAAVAILTQRRTNVLTTWPNNRGSDYRGPRWRRMRDDKTVVLAVLHEL